MAHDVKDADESKMNRLCQSVKGAFVLTIQRSWTRFFSYISRATRRLGLQHIGRLGRRLVLLGLLSVIGRHPIWRLCRIDLSSMWRWVCHDLHFGDLWLVGYFVMALLEDLWSWHVRGRLLLIYSELVQRWAAFVWALVSIHHAVNIFWRSARTSTSNPRTWQAFFALCGRLSQIAFYAVVPVRLVPTTFPTSGGDNFFYPFSWMDVYSLCYYVYNDTGYLRWLGYYRDEASVLYHINSLLPDYLKAEPFAEAFRDFITGTQPLVFVTGESLEKLETYFFSDFLMYACTKQKSDPFFFSRLLLDESFRLSILRDYFTDQFFLSFVQDCPDGVIYDLPHFFLSQELNGVQGWCLWFVDNVSLFMVFILQPIFLFFVLPDWRGTSFITNDPNIFAMNRAFGTAFIDLTQVSLPIFLFIFYFIVCVGATRYLVYDSPHMRLSKGAQVDDDNIEYRTPRYYLKEFQAQLRWKAFAFDDLDLIIILLLTTGVLYVRHRRSQAMLHLHIVRPRFRFTRVFRGKKRRKSYPSLDWLYWRMNRNMEPSRVELRRKSGLSDPLQLVPIWSYADMVNTRFLRRRPTPTFLSGRTPVGRTLRSVTKAPLESFRWARASFYKNHPRPAMGNAPDYWNMRLLARPPHAAQAHEIPQPPQYVRALERFIRLVVRRTVTNGRRRYQGASSENWIQGPGLIEKSERWNGRRERQLKLHDLFKQSVQLMRYRGDLPADDGKREHTHIRITLSSFLKGFDPGLGANPESFHPLYEKHRDFVRKRVDSLFGLRNYFFSMRLWRWARAHPVRLIAPKFTHVMKRIRLTERKFLFKHTYKHTRRVLDWIVDKHMRYSHWWNVRLPSVRDYLNFPGRYWYTRDYIEEITLKYKRQVALEKTTAALRRHMVVYKYAGVAPAMEFNGNQYFHGGHQWRQALNGVASHAVVDEDVIYIPATAIGLRYATVTNKAALSNLRWWAFLQSSLDALMKNKRWARPRRKHKDPFAAARRQEWGNMFMAGAHGFSYHMYFEHFIERALQAEARILLLRVKPWMSKRGSRTLYLPAAERGWFLEGLRPRYPIRTVDILRDRFWPDLYLPKYGPDSYYPVVYQPKYGPVKNGKYLVYYRPTSGPHGYAHLVGMAQIFAGFLDMLERIRMYDELTAIFTRAFFPRVSRRMLVDYLRSAMTSHYQLTLTTDTPLDTITNEFSSLLYGIVSVAWDEGRGYPYYQTICQPTVYREHARLRHSPWNMSSADDVFMELFMMITAWQTLYETQYYYLSSYLNFDSDRDASWFYYSLGEMDVQTDWLSYALDFKILTYFELVRARTFFRGLRKSQTLLASRAFVTWADLCTILNIETVNFKRSLEGPAQSVRLSRQDFKALLYQVRETFHWFRADELVGTLPLFEENEMDAVDDIGLKPELNQYLAYTSRSFGYNQELPERTNFPFTEGSLWQQVTQNALAYIDSAAGRWLYEEPLQAKHLTYDEHTTIPTFNRKSTVGRTHRYLPETDSLDQFPDQVFPLYFITQVSSNPGFWGGVGYPLWYTDDHAQQVQTRWWKPRRKKRMRRTRPFLLTPSNSAAAYRQRYADSLAQVKLDQIWTVVEWTDNFTLGTSRLTYLPSQQWAAETDYARLPFARLNPFCVPHFPTHKTFDGQEFLIRLNFYDVATVLHAYGFRHSQLTNMAPLRANFAAAGSHSSFLFYLQELGFLIPGDVSRQNVLAGPRAAKAFPRRAGINERPWFYDKLFRTRTLQSWFNQRAFDNVHRPVALAELVQFWQAKFFPTVTLATSAERFFFMQVLLGAEFSTDGTCTFPNTVTKGWSTPSVLYCSHLLDEVFPTLVVFDHMKYGGENVDSDQALAVTVTDRLYERFFPGFSSILSLNAPQVTTGWNLTTLFVWLMETGGFENLLFDDAIFTPLIDIASNAGFIRDYRPRFQFRPVDSWYQEDLMLDAPRALLKSRRTGADVRWATAWQQLSYALPSPERLKRLPPWLFFSASDWRLRPTVPFIRAFPEDYKFLGMSLRESPTFRRERSLVLNLPSEYARYQKRRRVEHLFLLGEATPESWTASQRLFKQLRCIDSLRLHQLSASFASVFQFSTYPTLKNARSYIGEYVSKYEYFAMATGDTRYPRSIGEHTAFWERLGMVAYSEQTGFVAPLLNAQRFQLIQNFVLHTVEPFRYQRNPTKLVQFAPRLALNAYLHARTNSFFSSSVIASIFGVRNAKSPAAHAPTANLPLFGALDASAPGWVEKASALVFDWVPRFSYFRFVFNDHYKGLNREGNCFSYLLYDLVNYSRPKLTSEDLLDAFFRENPVLLWRANVMSKDEFAHEYYAWLDALLQQETKRTIVYNKDGSTVMRRPVGRKLLSRTRILGPLLEQRYSSAAFDHFIRLLQHEKPGSAREKMLIAQHKLLTSLRAKTELEEMPLRAISSGLKRGGRAQWQTVPLAPHIVPMNSASVATNGSSTYPAMANPWFILNDVDFLHLVTDELIVTAAGSTQQAGRAGAFNRQQAFEVQLMAQMIRNAGEVQFSKLPFDPVWYGFNHWALRFTDHLMQSKERRFRHRYQTLRKQRGYELYFPLNTQRSLKKSKWPDLLLNIEWGLRYLVPYPSFLDSAFYKPRAKRIMPIEWQYGWNYSLPTYRFRHKHYYILERLSWQRLPFRDPIAVPLSADKVNATWQPGIFHRFQTWLKWPSKRPLRRLVRVKRFKTHDINRVLNVPRTFWKKKRRPRFHPDYKKTVAPIRSQLRESHYAYNIRRPYPWFMTYFWELNRDDFIDTYEAFSKWTTAAPGVGTGVFSDMHAFMKRKRRTNVPTYIDMHNQVFYNGLLRTSVLSGDSLSQTITGTEIFTSSATLVGLFEDLTYGAQPANWFGFINQSSNQILHPQPGLAFPFARTLAYDFLGHGFSSLVTYGSSFLFNTGFVTGALYSRYGQYLAYLVTGYIFPYTTLGYDFDLVANLASNQFFLTAALDSVFGTPLYYYYCLWRDLFVDVFLLTPPVVPSADFSKYTCDIGASMVLYDYFYPR